MAGEEKTPEVSRDAVEAVSSGEVTSIEEPGSGEAFSVEGTDTPPVGEKDKAGYITLYPGTALDVCAARAVTVRNRTHVIALTGAAESGKTTLLTSIYQKYQQGAFGGFLFSGSDTLLGFEERSHDSRLCSGRANAVTPRTPLEVDYRFLHLCVRPDAPNVAGSTEILFTDVSGEMYHAMRDSASECKKHVVLKRADHFVLLLDMARFVIPKKRFHVISEGQQLLRSCLEVEMLDHSSQVDVLFSKWDYSVQIGGPDPQGCPCVADCVQKYEDQFKDEFARMRFCYVAARPDPALNTSLSDAHGVEELWASWVKDGRDHCRAAGTKLLGEMREIDRFRDGGICRKGR